jgi:putative transposase
MCSLKAMLEDTTSYVEPASSCENGYNKSFNGKLSDDCLNEKFFYRLKEAKILIGQRRALRY